MPDDIDIKDMEVKNAGGPDRRQSVEETVFDVRLYVPYLVNRAATGLIGRFNELLKLHTISLSMWRILALLYGQGPLRFGALVTLSSLEPPSASRFIAQLLERGLISKTRSENDARGVILAITPVGRQIVSDILPQAGAVQDETLAGFTEDEIYLIRRLLQRICDNIAPLVETAENL